MKLMILGGSGMLGHKLFQVASPWADAWVTFRNAQQLAGLQIYKNVPNDRKTCGVDALSFQTIQSALDTVSPEVLVNCIGIVKQREEANRAVDSIMVNSLFPHLLASECLERRIRLIHLSTDCVFSGRAGPYREIDIPDPTDLYGRSKLLGELTDWPCVTLRTSMIGWELTRQTGLLEWFAMQRGKVVMGFDRALYTGLTTEVLARLIVKIIFDHPQLSGIYHVASEPISKYELLVKLKNLMGWQDIVIKREEEYICDRRLNGCNFSLATGWKSPGWDDMLRDVAGEWKMYRG